MTRVRHHADARGVPFYTVAEDVLQAGASLGNSALFAPLQAHGAVGNVFCMAAAAPLLGSFSVRYGASSGDGYVPLERAGVPEVELHPAYQRRRAHLGDVLEASETIFCPLRPLTAVPDDPALLYCVLTLCAARPLDLRVLGLGRLVGGPSGRVQASFDARCNAIVATDMDQPRLARALAATCAPLRWAVLADWGVAYDPWRLDVPPERCDSGDTLGALQVDVHLGPGTPYTFAFVLAVSAEGEAEVRRLVRRGRDHQQALEETQEVLAADLAVGRVLTPDPVVNDGALWSKVNMRRVMARTAQGAVFSNDPGKSPAVVGRDAAWFCYGADHAWPGFSRALLENFARLQAPDGLVPEFFHSVTGHAEDDGLNINDDTPLYVLACAHHARCTGDAAWVAQIYPAVQRAVDCILANRDGRGLIYCSAEDPRGNVWASATWRNIIPGYSLNGAVTEINAACVAALRAAGELAALVPGAEGQQAVYWEQAHALQAAMDHHLLDPQTGLYYLNIDTQGVAHADVTGDLVFPVFLGACTDETARRITRRLAMADLWTDAGLRTVSVHDPRYDPTAAVGLLGGVWPGLTWWYAFACRRYHPEMMARALRSSFAHYASEPRTTNTVPGQFSEWFDGQSLANRGMKLSPWEPPRFLWAAIEGVCGYEPGQERARVAPSLPPSWSWVALRGLPRGTEMLTYVAALVGEQLYVWATAEVWAAGMVEPFSEDVSGHVHVRGGGAAHVALRKPGCLWLFLGQVGTHAAVVLAELDGLLEPEALYRLHCYDSAEGTWRSREPQQGATLGQVAVDVEVGGFCIVEIRDV